MMEIKYLSVAASDLNRQPRNSGYLQPGARWYREAEVPANALRRTKTGKLKDRKSTKKKPKVVRERVYTTRKVALEALDFDPK